MATARCFPYLRYNPDAAGDPGLLLAPPYDVVGEQERRRLVAISPYQSALIELPEGGDNRVAGDLLRSWLDEGVLEEGEVGIAVVQQRYAGPDGVRRTRLGVLCEVQLAPYGDGEVLPHERTHDGPLQQRLGLMRQTGANVSPVFLAYHDPGRSLRDLLASVTDDPPDLTASSPDGTQIAIWYVVDPSVCDAFETAVEPHPLLIADGHHRYEAALAYREEVRAGGVPLRVVAGTDTGLPPHRSSAAENGVLAFVCNSADEGLCVFPTHRIVEGVDPSAIDEFVLGSGAFNVTDHDGAADALTALADQPEPGFVVASGGRVRRFAVVDPDDLRIAMPKTSDAYRSLDVVALHALLIDGGALLGDRGRVRYTRSADEAIAAANGRDDAAAFLLRAIDPAVVHAVAEAGDVMPPKSTYYYPKVPTGVVFRRVTA